MEATILGSSCEIHGAPPPPPLLFPEGILGCPGEPSPNENGGGGGATMGGSSCNNHLSQHSTSHWHHCPELHKAFDGVRYIADHTKKEEDSTKVKEDWKYVAMVLDRLFLWIFTLAVLVGSAGIILQAPTLYDDRRPIDVQLSDIASTTSKPQVTSTTL